MTLGVVKTVNDVVDSKLGLRVGMGLSDIDSLFRECVLEGYKDRSEENPRLDVRVPNKYMKWLFVSAMQKSIRFGMADEAAQLAAAVWHLDASYCVRRLAVIVLEDIGPADLKLCGMVLSLVSNIAWIRKNGGASLIAYVARRMAKSVKSRAICYAACCWMSDRECQQVISGMDGAESYIGEGVGLNSTYLQAYVETAAAHGEVPVPGKYRQYLPSIPEDFKVLTTGFSKYSQYIMHKGRKAQAETLHIGLAVWISTQTSAFKPLSKSNKVVNKVMIGGLVAPAYDKHTAPGKAAIKKFTYGTKDIVTHLRETPVARNMWPAVVGSAVFVTEGSQLDVEEDCSRTKVFRQRNFEVDCKRFELFYPEMLELYSIVLTNLGKLNDHRRVSKQS